MPKKKSVQKKRKNKHEIRDAYDAVSDNPTTANQKRYAAARRKKGTKADRDGLER